MATMYHALVRMRLSTFIVKQRFSTCPCIFSNQTDRLFIFSIETFSLKRPRDLTKLRQFPRTSCTTRLSSGFATVSHEEPINTKEAKLDLLKKCVDENVKEVIARYDGLVSLLVSQSKHGPNPLEAREKLTLHERWQLELETARYREKQEYVFCPSEEPNDQIVWTSGISVMDKLSNASMDASNLPLATTTQREPRRGESIFDTGYDSHLDESATQRQSIPTDPIKSESIASQNPFFDDSLWMNVSHFGTGNDASQWKDSAMALLTVMQNESWSLFGSHKHDLAEHELRGEGNLAEGNVVVHAGMNVIMEETDNVGQEDANLSTIESLLNEAESGEITLTTDEYNLILVAVATSPSTFHHNMVDIMMNAYMQMRGSAEYRDGVKLPNTDTYSILLHVLESRGHYRDGALEICSDITRNPEVWTNDLITKVVECYERNNKPILGQQFLHRVVREKKCGPSRDAFVSQIRALKRANMMQEALELLNLCVEANGLKDSSGVDEVVLELLRWRDGSSRFPHPIVVQAILDKINSFAESFSYIPSWKVWKQMTSSLGLLAQRDADADWEVVRKSTKALLQDVSYIPQMDILSIGLAASEALGDGQLAVELLQRSNAADKRHQQNSICETDWSEGSAKLKQRHKTTVPPEAFRKAINICISAGDIQNCLVLLDELSYSIPFSGQSEFFVSVAKGCVANKSPESALEVISLMRKKGLETSEEDYGTVMAGFVKAGKRSDALQILESMKSGQLGDKTVPGVTVYNAMLMSHIATGEWHEARSVYDTMRNLGVAPDSTTMQGLLIASNRLGDKDRTLFLLRKLFESDMSIDKHCVEHCMKILLPKQVRAKTVGDVRTKLRAYGTNNTLLKEASTALSRSLRIAEVEEERSATDRISERDLQDRRAKAWRDVMEKMLNFSRLLTDGNEQLSQPQADSQARSEQMH